MRRVALLLLLATGLFLLALGLTHDPRKVGPGTLARPKERPQPASVRLEGAPGPASSQTDTAKPAAGGETASWAAVGQVLRAGRHPAVGVAVELYLGTAPCGHAVSGGDGRYRIHPVLPPGADGWPSMTVVADDGRGYTARECRTTRLDREADLLFPSLTLAEGLRLEVRVVSASGPVPGAEVEVWGEGMQRQGMFAWGRTNASGELLLPPLRAGLVKLDVRAEGFAPRALFAGVEAEQPEPVVVELVRPRAVDVLVVRMPEGTPLAGVGLDVVQVLRRAHGSFSAPLRGGPEIAPTDVQGRTRVEGLGREDDLALRVEAPGFARRRYDARSGTWQVHGLRQVPIPPHAEEVRVEVGLRDVIWPLSDALGAVPPDGVTVRFDDVASDDGAPRVHTAMLPFGLETGRIEQGNLVVEGLGHDAWQATARSPDGLVADVRLGKDEAVGPPVVFFRPRTLTVVARTPEGKVLPKLMLRVERHDGSRIPEPIRWTDGQGVATWQAVPAFRGTVSVPGGGRHAFSLMEGDVRLEVEASPASAREQHALRIRVLVRGEPRLPDRYRIRGPLSDASMSVRREDASSGILHATWAPVPGSDAATFTLAAAGFVPVPIPAVVGQDEVSVVLEPAGSLRVVVLHREGEVPRWRPERWDGRTGTWVRVPLLGTIHKLPHRGAEHGHVSRYDTLAPGRYRIHAYEQGRSSEDVLLGAGEATRTVVFDLTVLPRIAGRIVAPPGTAVAHGYVELIAGDVRRELRLDEQGRFEVPWPAGVRSVRLVGRHPLLQPDAREGEVVLEGPREDVRLVLVPGGVAELVVKRAPGEKALPSPPGACRVLLLRNRTVTARLPGRIESLEDGTWRVSFAGYEPGTWTLWASLREDHAPIRIPAAKLDDLGALLGVRALEPGSRILLRVHPEEAAPGILSARASYLGAPDHERLAIVVGEDRIELVGLEAGRYRVVAGTFDPDAEALADDFDEVIEVDGRSAYERVIDLR